MDIASTCFCRSRTETVLRILISLRVARGMTVLASSANARYAVSRSVSASRRASRSVSVSVPTVVRQLVRLMRAISDSSWVFRRGFAFLHQGVGFQAAAQLRDAAVQVGAGLQCFG